MSDKSGISSQVISRPKGGGALSGMGESFAPDLHSGTGNFSVPIMLPPGRNQLQPELKLVYSTGGGAGPFGLGWSLSIPGVSRKTTRGVPRYQDEAEDHAERDIFVLTGAEDLVPVSAGPRGVTHYRPRTEGLFARIERHHTAVNDYWEVRGKDGLVSFYGTPGAAGVDPAVIADPADRRRVFAWNLSETVDPFGNRIVYEYARDRVEDGPHHADQLYLRRVCYVDLDAGADGEPRFLISVTFEYDERPDPFSSHRAGFEIRTRRLCRRIVVSTAAGQERVMRAYELTYDVDPHNGTSLLREVRLTGQDGARTQQLPPITFGYTPFTPEGRTFAPVTGPLPAQSLASPDLELADLFGNGLPDILELNETARYWRNLGGGRFDHPRLMTDAPAGLRLADPGVQMIDADGDGRIDLMVSNERTAGYFPLRFDGLWNRHSFRRYAAAPSFNLEDRSVQLVDLDGDGVTDAIRSGSRFECFFNDPHEGWNRIRFVERRALAEFPNVDFADPRVKWADLSGDGLQDIMLIHDGSVAYWPSLGHGDWGPQVVMRNSPRLPYDFDPRRLLAGDVDGDGLADLVYVDHRRVLLWINRGGSAWSDPVEIRGTPAVTNMDAVRLVDLLGSGIAGVLWSADATGRSRHQMFFLDFTGGVKPYLLDTMENHIGATTRVRYRPSTDFYLADGRRPATRWKTPLPFPVHVVAGVEVIDAFSGGKMTTTYSYHHGYWDGVEREFRGFGRVDQRDTEVFAAYNATRSTVSSFAAVPERVFSPPTETRTWFHQGPIGDEDGGWAETDFSAEFWPGDPSWLERPAAMRDFLRALPRAARRDALRALRGQPLRSETYALDGSEREDRPYTVTESLAGVREEAQPGPGEPLRRRIFFPHGLAQRTSQWERGDEPMTRFTYTGGYDAYGQPGSRIGIAVPRGRDIRAASTSGDPYLATQTLTTYAQKDTEQTYIVDRVARTTGYELVNDGSMPLAELLAAVHDGRVERRVIGQSLTLYDGAAFTGLPLGQLGAFGASVRTETLVLTDELMEAAYAGAQAPGLPGLPPYLQPGAPAWTDDYPRAFRDTLAPLAGYTFYADDEHASGYFTSAARRYDFHDDPTGRGRGVLLAARDALGRDTHIAYDDFALLAVRATDSAGMTTAAIYDYRMLQAREIVDPNGNRSVYAYTPLGMLESTAVVGAAGEGDTPEAPSTRLVYDLFAYAEARGPISVRTIRRVHHANDPDVPAAERDATIETVEYTDGFARLLQTRTQAEDVIFGGDTLPLGEGAAPLAAPIRRDPDDLPNVIVGGAQVHDNKGRIVEAYEPFLATGWDYRPPAEAEHGRKVTMHYDPRGQVVRTINPDGSEQRVVYGVPYDLADPQQFAPTPWETYRYDANDNAGRTHPGGDASHWNTPSSSILDAHGRTVMSVERNGQGNADRFVTRFAYDIRGNLLEVVDALGRVAFRYTYDLTPASGDEGSGANILREEQCDNGAKWFVLDAARNVLEQRDSKGALLLHAFDALNRPTHFWARDAAGEAITLRERMIFGDSPDAGLTETEARTGNLLGTLHRHFDEAGLLVVESYDFKGNPRERFRQVLGDAPLRAAFEAAPADNWRVRAPIVDWQPAPGSTLAAHAAALLDPAEYRTSTAYDALNRVIALRYPRDVRGERKLLRPRYNSAGALESVELDGAPFVEHIAYNARGQRTLIAYGNGVMTRCAYEPDTFRLARMRTERYSLPEPFRFHPAGAPLQDYAYRYDLAGNMLAIHDRTPGSGIPGSLLGADALDRVFSYDPLGRLLSATGRETDLPAAPAPWDDRPRGADLTRVRPYTETYRYDVLGNLLRLEHTSSGESFVRDFALVPGGNRLAGLTTGAADFGYTYDARGNLVREATSRHFEWDHSDRMRTYRTQVDGSEPSVYAHHLFNSNGQRVKKLVRKQGGRLETTVYIDGLFEHHRVVEGAATRENNTLHIVDDTGRIAMVRVGEPFADDTTPAVQYHLGDHLNGGNLVLDAAGVVVNHEEYSPYGETTFGSFARKRYRFNGKERDDGSGLYYHGARFYAPWLARWASCDPAGLAAGINPYRYAASNPLRFTDPTGLQDQATAATDPGGGSYPSTVHCPTNYACSVVYTAPEEVIVVEGKAPTTRRTESGRREYNICDGHGCRWVPTDVYFSNKRVQEGLAKDPKFFVRLQGAETSIYLFAAFEAIALGGGFAFAELGVVGVAKEVGGEVLSEVTGGATDVLSISKQVRNGGKKVLREMIEGINVQNGTTNCVDLSLATDMTLGTGRVWTAPASGLTDNAAEVISAFTGTTNRLGTVPDIAREIERAGDGARGVVSSSYPTGGGHVYNVVNHQGKVYFLDAQTRQVMTAVGVAIRNTDIGLMAKEIMFWRTK